MEGLKLSDEERKIILMLRLFKKLREAKKNIPVAKTGGPNQVKIMVSENLGIGEKVGN